MTASKVLNPDATSLAALNERRAAVLHQMQTLLVILDVEENVRTIAGQSTEGKVVGLLIGIGFSLWRAVFLAHAERDPLAVLEHGRDVLRLVVEDNAIGYPADKTHRAWTVGFYLNNARYRIEALSAKLKNDPEFADFVQQTPAYNDIFAPTSTTVGIEPYALWDKFFLPFSLVVAHFTSKYSAQ